MTLMTHTTEDTSMSTDWAEKEESKMGPQGDGSSEGGGCNDGDSDSEGWNMDDDGDGNGTDYDDGDGGHYYECGLGGRSN